MTRLGMDVDAARTLAHMIDRKADELDAVRREIAQLLRNSNWQGNDADAFRQQWNAQHQRQLMTSAETIRQAGKTLRLNIEAQERTSREGGDFSTGTLNTNRSGPSSNGSGDRGLPGSLDDWLMSGFDKAKDGLSWVGDRVHDGVDWVNDRIGDGIAWTKDRIEDGKALVSTVVDGVVSRASAFWKGLLRTGDAVGGFLSQFGRIFTEGRIPQPAELLASALIVGGNVGGLVWNTVTGTDHHFFDDGRPTVGEPTATHGRAPSDLREIVGIGHDSYGTGGVTVTAVTDDNGTTRFIVAVPGTEAELTSLSDGWGGNPNGRDWAANLYAVANGTSTATKSSMEAVDRAIEYYRQQHPDAVIPDRPEILLTGHSQGGILTANMSANEDFAQRYDIQGMITNGSPIDCAEIPSDVPVLALQHGSEYPTRISDVGDVIPRLDLGGWPGSPDNVTHGYLPSPSQGINPWETHPQKAYYDSLAPGTAGSQYLADWQNQNPAVSNYTTNDPNRYEHITVPIGRSVDD